MQILIKKIKTSQYQTTFHRQLEHVEHMFYVPSDGLRVRHLYLQNNSCLAHYLIKQTRFAIIDSFIWNLCYMWCVTAPTVFVSLNQCVGS